MGFYGHKLGEPYASPAELRVLQRFADTGLRTSYSKAEMDLIRAFLDWCLRCLVATGRL